MKMFNDFEEYISQVIENNYYNDDAFFAKYNSILNGYRFRDAYSDYYSPFSDFQSVYSMNEHQKYHALIDIVNFLKPMRVSDYPYYNEYLESLTDTHDIFVANEINRDNYGFFIGLKVVVVGNVDLRCAMLSNMPNIDFVSVLGDFDISGNMLTSLKCYDKYLLKDCTIGGKFLASNNELTSLEGFPKSVKGSIYINDNQIKSLEGCCDDIKDLYCSNNKLESLKYCPKNIGRSFDCSHNNIKSLKGCPQKLNGNFDCSYNGLSSLEFSPIDVEGNFNCSKNSIVEISTINSINGEFDCSSNLLKTLKGLPKGVIELDCGYNQMEEIVEGLPPFENFRINNNNLKNLKNFPLVFHSFDITNNEINNFDGMPVDEEIHCVGKFYEQKIEVKQEIIDIVNKRREKLKKLKEFNKKFNKNKLNKSDASNAFYEKVVKQKLAKLI